MPLLDEDDKVEEVDDEDEAEGFCDLRAVYGM